MNDRLIYTPLWGEPIHFTWGDVEKVKFSGTAQWWILMLPKRRKARISTYMNGGIDFMYLLYQKSGIAIPPATLPNGQKLHIQ